MIAAINGACAGIGLMQALQTLALMDEFAGHPDLAEGVASFVEKRLPVFDGLDHELGGSLLGQARQLPGTIFVDNAGKRFANESNSYVELGKAMYAAHAVPCWLIFDDAFRRRYPITPDSRGSLSSARLERGASPLDLMHASRCRPTRSRSSHLSHTR
jgi:hypothetical protein